MSEDPIRRRLIDLAAELPEAAVSGDQHLSFRIRGKPFAYHMIDHHGDGRIGLAVRTGGARRDALITEDPDRYYAPERLGGDWVAMDLELEPVNWALVRELTVGSYRLVAPKRLSASLEA